MERFNLHDVRMLAEKAALLDRQRRALRKRIEQQTAAFRAAVDFFRLDVPEQTSRGAEPQGGTEEAPPVPGQ
ncbi:hypothetical protein [Rugamonas apoptosis]|uniref:Uncharacterized protein n=1 Tax=Rugamonas apoptosis TaxID=2758570 RepID=A0A7W2FDX4_9BURK|nr:hypothetical protein [Rugamonas apoptosis]MBA5689900.1 hypothetical protein [Rugamonas apoptosis]